MYELHGGLLYTDWHGAVKVVCLWTVSCVYLFHFVYFSTEKCSHWYSVNPVWGMHAIYSTPKTNQTYLLKMDIWMLNSCPRKIAMQSWHKIPLQPDTCFHSDSFVWSLKLHEAILGEEKYPSVFAMWAENIRCHRHSSFPFLCGSEWRTTFFVLL